MQISILQFHGQALLYLEDRHGVPQPLASLGNNLCNNKSPTLLQDVGKIEDMNILPITAIIYGQTVFEGEVAKATIGPLVCIEKHRKSFQEETISSQNETKEAIDDLTQKIDNHMNESETSFENLEREIEGQDQAKNTMKNKIEELETSHDNVTDVLAPVLHRIDNRSLFPTSM